MHRHRISSGAKWEPAVGYSRAVRVGPHVHVAGTTATDEAGRVVGPGEAYTQAAYALQKIVRALAAAGARPEHVVRTRMFVTDIAQWEEVGRAHGEVFGEVRPAATMVEVARLIDPGLVVEIEVDAYVSDDTPAPAGGPEGVTVTHLQMLSPPVGDPSLPEGITVVRAEQPSVSFYRYLYDTVGADWQWTERRALSDDALRRIVQDPEVYVYVLYERGTPAGYVELDRRTPGEVQVAYFGLMPGFAGRGLGRAFLEWSVREAWRTVPRRVWVHTCTLDHPAALPLYRKVGFMPYKEERQGR